MLLIDTRTPRPDRPDRARAAWEPNWRLWTWVALAIGAGVGANSTSGLVAYALICATLVFVCEAVCVLLPNTFGLREYRQ
jgi:hypothetical protein